MSRPNSGRDAGDTRTHEQAHAEHMEAVRAVQRRSQYERVLAKIAAIDATELPQHCYLPFLRLSGRCVRAEAAAVFWAFVDLGLRRTRAAADAARALVTSLFDFLAMARLAMVESMIVFTLPSRVRGVNILLKQTMNPRDVVVKAQPSSRPDIPYARISHKDRCA